MLISFTLRARNKTRMLIISREPSPQKRTRKKMLQAEGKAGSHPNGAPKLLIEC